MKKFISIIACFALVVVSGIALAGCGSSKGLTVTNKDTTVYCVGDSYDEASAKLVVKYDGERVQYYGTLIYEHMSTTSEDYLWIEDDETYAFYMPYIELKPSSTETEGESAETDKDYLFGYEFEQEGTYVVTVEYYQYKGSELRSLETEPTAKATKSFEIVVYKAFEVTPSSTSYTAGDTFVAPTVSYGGETVESSNYSYKIYKDYKKSTQSDETSNLLVTSEGTTTIKTGATAGDYTVVVSYQPSSSSATITRTYTIVVVAADTNAE